MHDLLTTNAAVRSFCTFRLDQRLYGIEVAQIREVSPILPMTQVPQVPPAVRGLFNLRSRIYLALDLRPLLGLSPTECTADSRLMILKTDIGPDLGLLVECGGDIVHTTADLIEHAANSPDDTPGGPTVLITGVCKLKTELMVLIDLRRITELMTKLI